MENSALNEFAQWPVHSVDYVSAVERKELPMCREGLLQVQNCRIFYMPRLPQANPSHYRYHRNNDVHTQYRWNNTGIYDVTGEPMFPGLATFVHNASLLQPMELITNLSTVRKVSSISMGVAIQTALQLKKLGEDQYHFEVIKRHNDSFLIVNPGNYTDNDNMGRLHRLQVYQALGLLQNLEKTCDVPFSRMYISATSYCDLWPHLKKCSLHIVLNQILMISMLLREQAEQTGYDLDLNNLTIPKVCLTAEKYQLFGPVTQLEWIENSDFKAYDEHVEYDRESGKYKRPGRKQYHDARRGDGSRFSPLDSAGFAACIERKTLLLTNTMSAVSINNVLATPPTYRTRDVCFASTQCLQTGVPLIWF